MNPFVIYSKKLQEIRWPFMLRSLFSRVPMVRTMNSRTLYVEYVPIHVVLEHFQRLDAIADEKLRDNVWGQS